jgi:transcription elongation factor Elf1
MPAYVFRCTVCGFLTRRLMTVEKYAAADGKAACASCGQTAIREIQGPTSRTTETFDNGFSRPVERLVDAERIFQERATKHTLDHAQPEEVDPTDR